MDPLIVKYIKMAQPGATYQLRKRHPTNVETTKTSHGSTASKKGVENTDESSSVVLGEVTREDPHLKTCEGTTETEVVDIPVIDMEMFKQVEVADKLDLLMAAINKINTNFHYKFDAYQQQLTKEKEGIIPQIQKVQERHEELEARIEDLEGKIPSMIWLIN